MARATFPETHHSVHYDFSKVHLQTWAVPIGRFLFAILFVVASFNHFSDSTITMAANHGVPMANILVPLSGVMALFGGLSVLLGFYARIGALLLVAFLVPVTIMMHNFWDFTDPAVYQMQMIHFMKNLSMLGGAVLITYFGAGPVSLDAWKKP